MPSYCQRCGCEAELIPAPSGELFCDICIAAVSMPKCRDCQICYKRFCGDAIIACPLCEYGSEKSINAFEKRMRLAPILTEEKCERCGGDMGSRVFIHNGKALCRNCLVYEQDRWDIVPGKPGGAGARIKIILEKPKEDAEKEADRIDEVHRARRLFFVMGLDPDNLPPDPLRSAQTLDEEKMPSDRCASCRDEEKAQPDKPKKQKTSSHKTRQKEMKVFKYPPR